MPFIECVGELVEIGRTGTEEVSFEWRIQDVLLLTGENNDWYGSPLIRMGDECWYLSVRPNWKREAWNPVSGWVALGLVRNDLGLPAAFDVALGIRGSTAVQMSGKKEFWGCHGWYMDYFCSRSELMERKSTLMPDGVIAITCVLKRVVPSAATGDLSYRDASIQTNYEIKQGDLSYRDASIQTNYEIKQDAFDKEGNEIEDDEDDDASKNKKNAQQSSQVKNTKKISFPARHGNVIRSLEAILAEGRRADFTLKSGDREWPVHRAILEGRSGHFETLFRGELAERDEVRFDDVTEGELDSVLHFIYEGKVSDLSVGNVCGIYVAAHKFLLKDLKSLCVQYMKGEMCPELVCGALAVTEMYEEVHLKESALDCFFQEPERTIATEGWKKLKEIHPEIIGELFEKVFKEREKNRTKE